MDEGTGGYIGNPAAGTPRPRRTAILPAELPVDRDARSGASRLCANCGSVVPEAFCGVCGQRHATRLVSVRRMVMDVLDDQLLVNSALPRTLGNLLFRPGFLTREYVSGRIVRYIAPFRLYLVSSLIFFLLVTLLADPRELGEKVDRSIQRDSTRTTGVAPAARQGTFIRFGPMGDSIAAPPWWKPAARKLAVQEARINRMSKGELVRGLVAELERNAPTAMFLLLPVYALFLKLLYIRRKRLYVEHFVFALHIHAFSLLVFSVLLVIPAWVPMLHLLILWPPVYAFLAMKRMYGEGVLQTAGKFVLLGTSYLVTFLVGFLITLTVAALTI